MARHQYAPVLFWPPLSGIEIHNRAAVCRHSNLDGQINLRDAIRGNMTFKDPKTGKTYALKDKVGLHICSRSLQPLCMLMVSHEHSSGAGRQLLRAIMGHAQSDVRAAGLRHVLLNVTHVIPDCFQAGSRWTGALWQFESVDVLTDEFSGSIQSPSDMQSSANC